MGHDREDAAVYWLNVHENRYWPVVRFVNNIQGEVHIKTILPARMSIEDNLGNVICSRIH